MDHLESQIQQKYQRTRRRIQIRSLQSQLPLHLISQQRSRIKPRRTQHHGRPYQRRIQIKIRQRIQIIQLRRLRRIRTQSQRYRRQLRRLGRQRSRNSRLRLRIMWFLLGFRIRWRIRRNLLNHLWTPRKII